MRGYGEILELLDWARKHWGDIDWWCLQRGIDPRELPSRRLMLLVYHQLMDGHSPETIKKYNSILEEARSEKFTWVNKKRGTKPVAVPSSDRSGSGPGRPQRRPGPPPGWKSDEENLKSMASFLGGTGNARTAGQLAKASKGVTPNG